jgi:hypothetical protein
MRGQRAKAADTAVAPEQVDIDDEDTPYRSRPEGNSPPEVAGVSECERQAVPPDPAPLRAPNTANPPLVHCIQTRPPLHSPRSRKGNPYLFARHAHGNAQETARQMHAGSLPDQ